MMNKFLTITTLGVLFILLLSQCSKDNKDEFTIDDLIGSYDLNLTVTTIYNSDTTVDTKNEIVTINKNSSTYTLASNQLVARGLDGNSSEFVLDVTEDAFIIVEPPYAYNGKGTISQGSKITLDISFNIQNSSYTGIATKRQ